MGALMGPLLQCQAGLSFARRGLGRRGSRQRRDGSGFAFPLGGGRGIRFCGRRRCRSGLGRRAPAEGASTMSPVGRLDDGPKIAVAVPVLDQRDRASGKEDPHEASRDQPLRGSAPARPEARARVH